MISHLPTNITKRLLGKFYRICAAALRDITPVRDTGASSEAFYRTTTLQYCILLAPSQIFVFNLIKSHQTKCLYNHLELNLALCFSVFSP
jgi:hypothetical protein